MEARITSGEEEPIPAGVVDRLVDAEAPLQVWREFQNLTQADLARASGVNRVRIVGIEAGRATGSVHTLRKSADAPGVAVDDIIRWSEDGACLSTGASRLRNAALTASM